MYNKKLFGLVYFAFLFSSVFGKIMTKDEVLKIKPVGYEIKSEDQCPEYSNGDYYYLDRCGFEIYCKDNVCSSATRSNFGNSTVEFPDANGNMKSYIADVCVTTNELEHYQVVLCNDDLPKCSSDSDCLSNKCENNHCVPNDDVKIEKCQDTYHFHSLTASRTVDLKCGKPDGYSCKRDGDCASDKCTNSICEFQGRDHKLDGLSTAFLYFGIIVVVAIIGCIGCIIWCCKPRSKSRSIKTNAAANSV